jgi:hypothetical protein
MLPADCSAGKITRLAPQLDSRGQGARKWAEGSDLLPIPEKRLPGLGKRLAGPIIWVLASPCQQNRRRLLPFEEFWLPARKSLCLH